MKIKLIPIILSLIMFLVVIELIRREKLTFKYALAWMGIALLGLLLSIFEDVLFYFARTLGFELASNFIFFALISVFVFLSLLLTIFLCQQNDRNDKMAQKIGLLEYELGRLKDQFKVQSVKEKE